MQVINNDLLVAISNCRCEIISINKLAYQQDTNATHLYPINTEYFDIYAHAYIDIETHNQTQI